MQSDRTARPWLPLTRGDEVVGHVRLGDCDNYFQLGRFRPGPAFARYEPLLAEVYRRSEADDDDWLDALGSVNELGLKLADSAGGATPVRDFQLGSLDGLDGPDGVPIEFKYDPDDPEAAAFWERVAREGLPRFRNAAA